MIASPSKRKQMMKAILHDHPGNDCAIQRLRIQKAIEQIGSVSTFEASRYLDTYDARKRVSELRKAGYAITTYLKPAVTESGVIHHIGVYLKTP